MTRLLPNYAKSFSFEKKKTFLKFCVKKTTFAVKIFAKLPLSWPLATTASTATTATTTTTVTTTTTATAIASTTVTD